MLNQEYVDLGELKVVTISGRENYEYGIWGSISEQLGQWDLFKEYNTQLKAPGENAWVNLLEGQKVLILLDELPPYLDYARTEKVGNADLAVVTTRALSNLFSALGKAELSQVCVVLSDLDAAYEAGSQMVHLEQRKGRIQRIGQLSAEVKVYNLRYQDSIEDKVHEALSERLQAVHDLFGQVPDTLSDIWIDILEGDEVRARERIDYVMRQNPFVTKYDNIPTQTGDWSACKAVLSKHDAQAQLLRGWDRNRI